ncbi:putative porin [Aequorivita nionensis]|uniref:putative porin n=1 Tax=Aequorivita nionensis TaxID=1287690 RepID=UPI002CB33AFB|nr:putative porin [Aequorivita sp.]
MKKTTYLLFFLLFPFYLIAQNDSIPKKLKFSADFRFRVEQDWDSQKSDGTLREDRTRLRYRARLGATYDFKDWVSFGMRIRTGQPNKQQDPQLTLGDEFSSAPIAFEKLYANFKYNWLSFWIGKNSFPFEKQNELFWSDNVSPEGVSLSGKFNFENDFLQSLKVNTGHFIFATSGTSLSKDSYFEGIQLVSSHWQNRVKFFPAFYYFKNMPNIPDGGDTFNINYSILHLGTKVDIIKNPKITVGFDYYQNIQDYNNNDSIPKQLQNQKIGYVANAGIGKLDKKGDWKVQLTYNYLERFAAVDYLAQNDWARWDYSNAGSADGRLTNFKGLEIMAGYTLAENMDLRVRFFTVEQIVPYGIAKENGNRIRLDFNIGF